MASADSISVEDLGAAGLDHLFKEVTAAVGDHVEGAASNVAVVSEPFAGRDVLLEYADEELGVASERVTVDGVVDECPEFPTAEVVLVEDCQYLYERRIGGFDVLDQFLDRIAASDAMFVTAWNSYAWDYLTEVRDVDDDFPVEIRVPELDQTRMTDLLASNYAAEMPDFVETGEAGRVKTVDVERRTVEFAERSVEVTLPDLNPEYLLARSDESVDDTEAVVFQKLTLLSDGNPGVAAALWERSVRDGEIAPAYLEEVDVSLDLDDDEALVLAVVCTKERIDIDTLGNVLESTRVDRAVEILRQRNLVRVDEGAVEVDPEHLHAATEHLEGRRLLW